MKTHNYSKKSAFTLAETLIALAIIGIVAVMTIPALLVSKEKTENMTRLKKAYTSFNQALTKLTDDYGCAGNLECTGLIKVDNGVALGDELAKRLKVSKNCGIDTAQHCFSTSVNDAYNGTGANVSYDYGYRFTTLDGIAFMFKSSNAWLAPGTGNLARACGLVRIDVNGPDVGPNYYGRDVFWFYLANGKGALLYPVGGPNDASGTIWPGNGTCTNSNANAQNCAGRIMQESWTINYY